MNEMERERNLHHDGELSHLHKNSSPARFQLRVAPEIMCRIHFTLAAVSFFTLSAIARAGYVAETFVMAVGGQSNYSTFGAPAPVFNFFGSRGPGIPSNPAGLAASGISGGYTDKTTTSGSLSDSISVVSPNFGTTWSSSNIFAGSASANAGPSHVGASANGTLSGWGDSFTVAGSEAFGLSRDSLTFTHSSIANGANGFVQFHITVDGSLSISGVGTGGVEVDYQQNSGPVYTLMSASVDPRFGAGFYPFTGTGRQGFSISNTATSGSGSFDTFVLPIVFGQSFDFTLGLLASTIPEKDAAINVNFQSTAAVTGIDVFDAAGNQLRDFSVAAGSGARYDATGVHSTQPVPEPATLTLLGFGCIGVIAVSWRRRIVRGEKSPLQHD